MHITCKYFHFACSLHTSVSSSLLYSDFTPPYHFPTSFMQCGYLNSDQADTCRICASERIVSTTARRQKATTHSQTATPPSQFRKYPYGAIADSERPSDVLPPLPPPPWGNAISPLKDAADPAEDGQAAQLEASIFSPRGLSFPSPVSTATY